MYILFNSAFKHTYLENVFKISVSPLYSKITMRFSEKNFPQNLDISKSLNEKCVIVFIDRFNPGQYKYIPLRFGKINSIHHEIYKGEKRYFINLTLYKYCNIVNQTNLFEKITQHNPNAPRLQNYDPYNDKDGEYIQKINSLDFEDILESNEESWSRMVESINSTKIFSEQKGLLFKTEIMNNKGNLVESCKSGETYNLSLTYYNPSKTVHSIDLEFFPPLARPGSSKIATGCSMDKVNFSFMIDKVYQCNSWGCITIKESSLLNEISFELKLQPVFFNNLNIILMVVFGIVLLLPFFDFVFDHKIIYGIVEVLKWIVGFFLFVRLGKPVA